MACSLGSESERQFCSVLENSVRSESSAEQPPTSLRSSPEGPRTEQACNRSLFESPYRYRTHGQSTARGVAAVRSVEAPARSLPLVTLADREMNSAPAEARRVSRDISGLRGGATRAVYRDISGVLSRAYLHHALVGLVFFLASLPGARSRRRRSL